MLALVGDLYEVLDEGLVKTVLAATRTLCCALSCWNSEQSDPHGATTVILGA